MLFRSDYDISPEKHHRLPRKSIDRKQVRKSSQAHFKRKYRISSRRGVINAIVNLKENN